MAFAVSTIVAGVGVAIAGYGAYENYSNTKAASQAQAAAAQQQAAIAAIQAKNVGVERQKLALTTQQEELQIATNKNVIGLQQQQDDIRQQSAQLDATRRIRQAIRTGSVAAGASLNAAADSGAAAPGSTAVKQARANIAGNTDVGIQGVNQNLDVGNRIFNLNKSISQTYLAAQDQNKNYVEQSAVLQGQTLDNQEQIYKLGGTASLDYASAAIDQGNAAAGAGLYSLGGSIASTYNSGALNRLTNFFTSSSVGSSDPVYNTTAGMGYANA